jgi:hypothetical protein
MSLWQPSAEWLLKLLGTHGICPVLIINILIGYLITIQWSNGQELACLVLPAGQLLNDCTEIITTIPRNILTGECNRSRAGCVAIEGVALIPEGAIVVPPSIDDLVGGNFNHLCHIWVDSSLRHPKRLTPAPLVRPHQLELWNGASHDWIKKDYIIKVVPGPHILDSTINCIYVYIPGCLRR